MPREVLEKLILSISDAVNIREDIIEKDYYVCLILKDLSRRQKALKTYFKG